MPRIRWKDPLNPDKSWRTRTEGLANKAMALMNLGARVAIYAERGHDVICFQTHSDLVPRWNDPDADRIKPGDLNNSAVDSHFLFDNQEVSTYPAPPQSPVDVDNLSPSSVPPQNAAPLSPMSSLLEACSLDRSTPGSRSPRKKKITDPDMEVPPRVETRGPPPRPRTATPHLPTYQSAKQPVTESVVAQSPSFVLPRTTSTKRPCPEQQPPALGPARKKLRTKLPAAKFFD